jgi:adenosylcobinamide kinase/adenosylcobinamide-phosphate guanylyltransferase
MTQDRTTLTLVLGGARSGKSTYGEMLARKLGQRVVYIATAEALDEEMRARVAKHQSERPKDWITLEAPLGVGAALRALPAAAACDVILVDCLTLLVTNIILSEGPEAPEMDSATAWQRVEAELHDLIESYQHTGADLILVSNEVGLGVVPPYSLGRTFRDTLGRANQMLAHLADRVIYMIAGLPVDVKDLPLAWP